MTHQTPDSDTPEIQDTIRDLDRLAQADRQVSEGFEDRLLAAVLTAQPTTEPRAMAGCITHEADHRTPPARRRGRSVFAFAGGLSAIAAVLLAGFLLRPAVTPSQSESMLALSNDDDAWLLAEVMDTLESSDTHADALDELANELRLLNDSKSDDIDILDLFVETSDGGVL